MRMMSENRTHEIEARIRHAFKDADRPNTQPRRILAGRLVEMARTGETFCIEDLWMKLRAAHGGIGRATVFRSIEQLVEKRVLDRIELPDGSHRYRVCGIGHHHHLVCTVCHRIVEFEGCFPESAFAEIAETHGFAMEDHEITLYGTCSRCRNDSPADHLQRPSDDS